MGFVREGHLWVRSYFSSMFLHLQHCSACLIRLIWMVLEMGVRWLYSCYFVECCFQDLFNIVRSILVQYSSCFFPLCFVSVHVVHPYSGIDTTTACKKLRWILSEKSDFLMIDNLSIEVSAFASCVLMSFSVDEMLLPRYVNLSTRFREPPFSVGMSPFLLNSCTPFFLHSHVGQCHTLPALDYASRIQLRSVYLPEALCHLRL